MYTEIFLIFVGSFILWLCRLYCWISFRYIVDEYLPSALTLNALKLLFWTSWTLKNFSSLFFVLWSFSLLLTSSIRLVIFWKSFLYMLPLIRFPWNDYSFLELWRSSFDFYHLISPHISLFPNLSPSYISFSHLTPSFI